MSADDAGQLRTLSFGDVEGQIWGAALFAGSGVAALGLGGASVVEPVSEWEMDGVRWRLAGAGFELEVHPATEERESFPPTDAREPVHGVQELVRVHGTVARGGSDHHLECVGTRSAIDGVDLGALASLRAVAGWFDVDEAFTLLSLRAARGRGQESDLVAATLFDPEGWVPVHDPRLSTTYDGAGLPTRMNLELWVNEGENEYPRRAAGEAAAATATATADGLDLRAVPLRCHSRGREGAGVYVLADL